MASRCTEMQPCSRADRKIGDTVWVIHAEARLKRQLENITQAVGTPFDSAKPFSQEHQKAWV